MLFLDAQPLLLLIMKNTVRQSTHHTTSWSTLFATMTRQGILQNTSAFVLILCVSSAISAPTCPEDHYWDSGVDNCEHCRDICINAERQKTVEACQQNCPAYPKKQIADQKLNRDAVTESNPDDSSNGANIGLYVGLGVAAAVGVLAVAAVVFILRRLKKGGPVPTSPAYIGVQESQNGRQGKQAIALLGSSREEVDEEEETFTKICGPIYISPDHQTAGFNHFSVDSTKV